MEFKSKHASDVLEHKPAQGWHTFHNSDTVSKALEVFAKEHILGAPILDAQNKLIAVVDVLDLTAALVNQLEGKTTLDASTAAAITTFQNTPLSHVINLSTRDRPLHVAPDLPLTKLIATLSSYDIHRVMVSKDGDTFEGLIPQFRLLQFLASHKSELPIDTLLMKVEKWGDFLKAVEVVNGNHTLLDGFRQIIEKKVSAVAIVNNKGQFVANLSASDLLKAKLPEDLFVPLHQWLKVPSMEGEDTAMHSVFVTKDSTLDDTLQHLLTARVHRAYILDDHKRPIGVAALSDVIRQFVEL